MSNALLQSLADTIPAAAGSALPTWYRDRQTKAWQAAQAAGWPQRGVEAWKYTSLYALSQRSPAAAARPEAAGTGGVVGARFVDGHCLGISGVDGLDGVALESLGQALSRDDERLRFAIAREEPDQRLFGRINTAMAVDGAWLRVAAGAEVDPWLTLDGSGLSHEADSAWHLAHRIELGEGASARVIIDLRGAATPSFATVSTQIRVQHGARLHLVWLNAGSDAFSLFANTRMDLDAGTRLDLQVVDTGGAPSRHDLGIALQERASAKLGGVFLLGGRRHADLQLDLRHAAGNADSETVWRIIADDRSRAVFNGAITVAPGADGTDARLGCKSLLGSAQAEVDARPVLEIHADDVKCAHGATVGQLDGQALFYLRSRGIPGAQARSLLQRAFAVEAFSAEPDSPAATHLNALLAREGG